MNKELSQLEKIQRRRYNFISIFFYSIMSVLIVSSVVAFYLEFNAINSLKAKNEN